MFGKFDVSPSSGDIFGYMQRLSNYKHITRAAIKTRACLQGPSVQVISQWGVVKSYIQLRKLMFLQLIGRCSNCLIPSFRYQYFIVIYFISLNTLYIIGQVSAGILSTPTYRRLQLTLYWDRSPKMHLQTVFLLLEPLPWLLLFHDLVSLMVLASKLALYP